MKPQLCSKENGFVEKFPEKELIVRSVTPKKKSKVRMLGYDKPLKWSLTGDGGARMFIGGFCPSEHSTPYRVNRECRKTIVDRIANNISPDCLFFCNKFSTLPCVFGFEIFFKKSE
jgi:hypothetical protein